MIRSRRAASARVAGLLLAGVLAAGAAVIVPATAAADSTCATSRVLLLGSYPAEVDANLAREHVARHQPTTLNGHEFFVGRLAGRRVILGIAGPAPSATYRITALALRHFDCVSAVVFSGTAGGGGRSGLGDVTVASRWTGNGGRSFMRVPPEAMAVARQTAAAATARLGRHAAVNDGPCACSGVVHRLEVVPVLRRPRVVLGGNGTTYGGKHQSCVPGGGEIEGCNPCPPGQLPPTVHSRVARGAETSNAAARLAARSARAGRLVGHPGRLLERFSPPSPRPARASARAHAVTYVADDQQTTAAMRAAREHDLPFIAFRGISDTDAVGNLWPFEYLVYQQLAADNAAVAARLWIHNWRG